MRIGFALLLCLISPVVHAAETVWEEHPEWATEFSERGVAGTALIYDEASNRTLVFDRKRAQTRFSPASTFKVFNAMVALETGAVKDEYEVIRWDGVERQFPDWNRDHSLASGMKFSVVWFYQEMARRAGQQRMQHWINETGYGNRDIGGGIDRFWLSGALRISAVERNRIPAPPFRPVRCRSPRGARRRCAASRSRNPRRTMCCTARPAGRCTRTSSAMRTSAWYVGWVERDGRRWFFAINIDMAHGGDDAPKRVAIGRALLASVGALPTR